METKNELVLAAKFAEQAEGYDDKLSRMKSLVENGVELTTDEGNLFFVAYKNVVEARKYSLRIISSLEEKKERTEDSKGFAEMYRAKIEKELKDICEEVLSLIDRHLIPKASNAESKVFYHKMKGDYFRYLAEIAVGDDRKTVVENSHQAYIQATEISKKEMKSVHVVALGLALNYSKFLYEILNAPEEACNLAQTACDDALAELDTLDEESYKDSTLIMQLLHDNIALYT